MLKDKLKNYQIILASGSPRRQQFLKEMEIDFAIKTKDIPEIYPTHLQAEEITNYLAQLKADAFENELSKNEILITSDTIVWLNNEALGKPKDYEDAVSILQKLSGVSHEVITSVCFKTLYKSDIIFEKTKVTFAPLPLEAIHFYLTQYKPFDKAGAYGIQDWIGLNFISNIEGSYTNVVGLPTQKVFNFLYNL